MAGANAVRVAEVEQAARHVYDRIGQFLFAQELEPSPTNYAFVYQLLANGDSPLARVVAAMTEGGVRLTERDIEALGLPLPAQPETSFARAEGLMARTQMQVEGFEEMMHAMRAETEGFGRDLAASAAAIDRSRAQAADEQPGDDQALLDQVARITTTMLQRVRTAESRLESATREASELRKQLAEARSNARRDPLTDLPNRRALEEAFAAKSAAGIQLCLAVCDIDHFKQVNDRFGHVVGDRVLKAIAELLSGACAGHLVARYGGEEFAVLFEGLQPRAARAKLETARSMVAAKHYRVRETDAPLGEVTFSAGLTAVQAEDSYQSAFQRADALLYAAKDSGRNSVRFG